MEGGDTDMVKTERGKVLRVGNQELCYLSVRRFGRQLCLWVWNSGETVG